MFRDLRTAAFVFFLLVVLTTSAFCRVSVGIAFRQGNSLYMAERQVSEQPTPAVAAKLLLQGPAPDETAQGIMSAIPAGTQLLGSYVDDLNKLHLDVSGQYLAAGSSDAQIESMADQWFATLAQFRDLAGLIITIEGRPLGDFIKPAVVLERAPDAKVQASSVQPLGVSGKKIALSPGHGRFWNGSGWYYQRGQYCGNEEEDLRNLKNSIVLKKFLENHGAVVKMARQTDMTMCCSPYDGNRYWWQMASSYWLKQAGYPSSVYASLTGSVLGSGNDESSDDIRARPLMSDYENTDIYISLHTNGSSGYCTGTGCPTGTDTFYDAGAEHAAWGAVSQQLANAVQPNIVSAINTAMPEINPDWASRGIHDSNGNYGEIRIPDRAAILTEIGFHDTCDRDASLMQDNFFRSAAMWGVYKGICQYFGDTPTPMYSAEYVSDDIPAVVNQGEIRTVHITFRNKGVLWSNARAFKLGAVGDSDPFAATRQSITGEIGPNDTYTFTFQMIFAVSGNQTTDWRMVRDGFAWFGDTFTKTVYVTETNDAEPPSVPQNLRVTASTQNSISIAWDPSTDNVGVYGYRIFRDGTEVGTTQGTSFTDLGLTANTVYSYQVEAYDIRPNYSGPSAVLTAMTKAGIFSDGFENLDNWILDASVAGNTPLQVGTGTNHGSIPGAGSAYAQAGSAHFMYHWLDTTIQSLTEGGYRTGLYSGWIYDLGTSGMRTGLRLYGYDSAGATKVIYWIGVTNGNPPNLSSNYIAGVWSGTSWTYYDMGPRSAGWHQLSIEILPYTGSNDVRFRVDGTTTISCSQPAQSADATFKRIYIGFNYNVNVDHWFDDITFDSGAPAAPSSLTGTGISENTIRWSFTDNANNEIGCRVYSGATRKAQREVIDTLYVDEAGLTPNTSYSRTVKAYAGALESAATNSASTYTLSVPPSTANVTCNKPVGAWQTQSAFMFTAVGGFGAGKVSYYAYAWDQQPTHTWDGFEWTWASPTLTVNATTGSGGWYLHVQGYNNVGQSNGTLDLGPYYYDSTAPSGLNCADSGQYTMSSTSLKALLTGAADSESGVTGYRVAVGSTPGAADVTGTWIDIGNQTNPIISGISLTSGNTYYISAQAGNAAGLWSSTATADGITAIAPTGRISGALAAAPGTIVGLQGKLVTSASTTEGTIEESDRSSALRVEGEGLQQGMKVDLIGSMAATAAPRGMTLISIESQTGATIPDPLGMTLRNLGGTDFGPNSPGVALGFGLYNLNMLVRVYGTVISHDDTSFTIDDGSVADNGTGTPGVKVLSGSLHKPADGAFAVVTGISTVVPGSNIRAVMPRSDADITP